MDEGKGKPWAPARPPCRPPRRLPLRGVRALPLWPLWGLAPGLPANQGAASLWAS